MGADTAIAWTDHTFNPWWGCERVSPGCQHCYAEAFAKRTGHKVWGKAADRRFFGDKHWAQPLHWNAAAEASGRPALVFCASMADVFEDRPELEQPRRRLFELVRETPHLLWQLLTKRPQNVAELVPGSWVGDDSWGTMRLYPPDAGWPSNVWIGTTVEDQQRADERIPELLGIPAPVRFLSCEPLLGPVDVRPWLPDSTCDIPDDAQGCCICSEPREVRVDWVICGGESGAGHRPLHLDDARSLRYQCEDAGVPFFFKQVGGRTPTAGGDLLDGRQHKAFPAEAQR